MTNNQETNTTDVEKAFEEWLKGLSFEEIEIMKGARSPSDGIGAPMRIFTAGARSRDEEVEQLKDQLREAERFAGYYHKIRQDRYESAYVESTLYKIVTDQLREAVKVLGSFDEYRSASDRGETSKTQWHTFERILYDRTRQFLTKHHLKVRKRDE